MRKTDVLATVGPLDADFAPLSGFTIVTDASGGDHAFAATAGKLYTIDLTTGHAAPVGTIGASPLVVVSLAATSATEVP